MTKSIIITAAASAFLFAAPAFAQDAGHHPAFNGPHGSASDLTDRPPSDPTAAHHPAFKGPHGSASDLTDRPPSDPTAVRGQYRQLLGRDPQSSAAQGHVKVFNGTTGSDVRSASQGSAEGAKPGRRPGFEGPHGSATNLTDTPREAQGARRATLYGRKAGDDKRSDAQPARPNSGLTKVGAGTLTHGTGGTSAARAQSQNNIRAMGTANAPR